MNQTHNNEVIYGGTGSVSSCAVNILNREDILARHSLYEGPDETKFCCNKVLLL